MRYILDIETDNLLKDVTKVHCVVLRDVDTDEVHTFAYDMIKVCIDYMDKADVLIGHNLLAYDLPVLKKLWGYEFKGEVIDTLVCSRTIWANATELDAKQKKLPSKRSEIRWLNFPWRLLKS